MIRRLAGLGLLLLAVLTLVTVRVVWSSRVEWRAAETLSARGDLRGAIDHYGRAARLYAPGSPFVRRSLERLESIAATAEAARDPELALTAWRELRSSILATRSFYVPSPERLARSNQRIAQLSAALEPPSVAPGQDLAARTRWHAARLAHDDAPSVLWSLLALAGLAGWIAAAVGFYSRGLDDDARLRPRPALAFTLGFAAAMALFLVALSRA